MLCTQQYGGPQTAHVTGRWSGEPVDLELTRVDGCRISQWDSLGPLLPAGLTTEALRRPAEAAPGVVPQRSRVVRSTRSIAVHRPSAMARPLVEPVASRPATAGASGRSPTSPCSTAAYSPLTRPAAACRSSARDSSVVRPAASA